MLQRGKFGGGRADATQEAADPGQQVVGLLVAIVDQRGISRVQRDPGPGGFTNAARQPIVVGVNGWSMVRRCGR